MLRFLVLAAALVALAGCPKPEDPVDAGSDAGSDGGVTEGAHCLDSPGELTRAPNGQLPCELLPPGFKR